MRASVAEMTRTRRNYTVVAAQATPTPPPLEWLRSIKANGMLKDHYHSLS